MEDFIRIGKLSLALETPQLVFLPPGPGLAGASGRSLPFGRSDGRRYLRS